MRLTLRRDNLAGGVATERISLKDFVTPINFYGDRVTWAAPDADGFTTFSSMDTAVKGDNPTSATGLTDLQKSRSVSAEWTVKASLAPLACSSPLPRLCS